MSAGLPFDDLFSRFRDGRASDEDIRTLQRLLSENLGALDERREPPKTHSCRT